MATRLTKKIPKDFPDTLPDLMEVNGVPIRTDLLVDVLADLNIKPELAHEIIVCLLDPKWGED